MKEKKIHTVSELLHLQVFLPLRMRHRTVRTDLIMPAPNDGFFQSFMTTLKAMRRIIRYLCDGKVDWESHSKRVHPTHQPNLTFSMGSTFPFPSVQLFTAQYQPFSQAFTICNLESKQTKWLPDDLKIVSVSKQNLPIPNCCSFAGFYQSS